MKNGIKIAVALVLAVILGGLSMGCIDKTMEDTWSPEEIVVPEVLPEEFNGSEEFEGTTIVIELVIVEVEPEVEVITYKYNPVLTYDCVYIAYPENLVGFDTIGERAHIYQVALDKVVEKYESDITYQKKIYRYYQRLLDKYAKTYEQVGNTILTDSDSHIWDVTAFNFTSPWGVRDLGNGSFSFDISKGKVSFSGSEDIASGGYVNVTSEGATISDMYYTYMGNNATLTGNTEVSF